MNQKTLFHVTSSIYKNQILEKGLFPKKYTKSDIARHIKLLLPNENTNKLLEQILTYKSGASTLLRGRLEEDTAKLWFMSSNEGAYYENICDCVSDGGEFYTMVRKALEIVTSISIHPPYPEAYPITCKASFNTYISDDGCRYAVIPGQIDDILVPGSEPFELFLNGNLSPSHLSIDDIRGSTHR